MKINWFKPLLPVVVAGVLAGCSSSAPMIVSTPVENIDNIPLKVVDLNDDQLKNWSAADLETDTIPGMSVDKAYAEIIKNNKPSPVIVAVIDSGVDIDHEDLKNVIWTNPKEIPGNGKDDDKNGYIDDVHGWNFLGDAVAENMEYVRIYNRYRSKYENKAESSISASDKAEYQLYKRAKAEFDKEIAETKSSIQQYTQIKQTIEQAHASATEALGTPDYTKEQIADWKPQTQELQQAKNIISQIQYNVDENIPKALEQLDEALDYYNERLDVHFKLDLNGREIVGDDPYDITDTDYGNNEVTGPDPKKEDLKHGTHVAGIIAAQRNNGIGIDGVANNAQIMVLRTVPDGDEYDKDVALAIRYAVDNGAKVINTSFGKYFSQNPEWVMDALEYAAKKDVLIVNAAGNESLDLDTNMVYPNDQEPGSPQEISDSFLVVGSLNYEYGADLVSTFSNYGKTNVDVFAPGTKIWSTVPNNEYEFLQGTSMASPAVAGVATLIRGYYPKLSAAQVKQIIMDSGLSTKSTVIIGGDVNKKSAFGELSTSGKMVNLYNALILASQVANK